MAEKRSVNYLGLAGGVLAIVLGGYGYVAGAAAWYAGAVILAGLAMVVAVLLAGQGGARAPEAKADQPAEPVKAPAMPPVEKKAPAEGQEALMLLGLLQEKGRFMDFLMDDVTAYSDAQVGAAARVVHQGCRGVIKEVFSPEPVSTSPEGDKLTLEADYPRPAYRLSGSVTGEPPYHGVLRHKGWKAQHVNLPRKVTATEDTVLVIAPASVEVR